MFCSSWRCLLTKSNAEGGVNFEIGGYGDRGGGNVVSEHSFSNQYKHERVSLKDTRHESTNQPALSEGTSHGKCLCRPVEIKTHAYRF